MVMAPECAVAFVLPKAVNATVPLPVPPPDLIVMSGSLLTAVHSQSVPWAFTLTVFDPPFDGRLMLVALRVNVQAWAAAAWLIVNVCPWTVMLPERLVEFVLPSNV